MPEFLAALEQIAAEQGEKSATLLQEAALKGNSLLNQRFRELMDAGTDAKQTDDIHPWLHDSVDKHRSPCGPLLAHKRGSGRRCHVCDRRRMVVYRDDRKRQMIDTIKVDDNPLLLVLPDWIDTNYEYQLVWDPINESWTVLPF